MKKLFYVLGLFAFALTISACGEKTTQTSGADYPNLRGETFRVMCDDKTKCDPRQANYERLFKNEKIKKITEVEKNYNIKVEFIDYPGEASWGGARERYIQQQAILGEKSAEIYEVNSSSVGKLTSSVEGVDSAILPIDDLIAKYGNPGYWPEKKVYGQFLGKTYSYDDMYSQADEGIYYNVELLEKHGYVEKSDFSGNTPAELWLRGEWNWAKFKEMVEHLNQVLNEDSPTNPQYPLGGRTYNWAYQFIGSNGGHLVTPELEVQLARDENVEALNFLNSIYNQKGMWRDESPLSNATEPEFAKGDIAFHNGQSYWIFQSNKWANRNDNFRIGFVPYPVGPQVKEDLSNYYVNDVYGKVSYVISRSFLRNPNDPYADMQFNHDNIFRIWNDLQYFPEIDEKTGYVSIDAIKEEFDFKRLSVYYGNDSSIKAHLSVINKNYPDLFYASSNSNNQVEAAYMLKIQNAVRNGEVRLRMEEILAAIQADFEQLYGVKK